MAVSYTTKLGLAKQDQGETNWDDLARQNRDRLEARLTTQYAGDPNGNVAGYWVGQLCYDTTNKGFWVCATATGDAATSVWAKTAVLMDDAVTLAKLAPGTAGKFIGFDASGDPAELDAGGISHYIDVRLPTNQSIPSDVLTTVIFGEEVEDADGVYDPTTGIYAPGEAGLYMVVASAYWDSGAMTGFVEMRLSKNGLTSQGNSIELYRNPVAQSGSTYYREMQGSATIRLGATDNLRIMVYQNTGGAYSLYGEAQNRYVYFQAWRIGD